MAYTLPNEERLFSNGEQQTRFIREMIFGKRGRIRCYQLVNALEK